MSSNKSHRPGFSLVELLLFSGIIAIMAGAMTGLSLIASRISSHGETTAEVEKTGELVLHRISRAIQEADIIVSPTAGAVLDSLLLVQTSPLKETFIHAHHGYVRMIETVNGESIISYLTNADVHVAQMLFIHTGSTGNAGVSFAFSVGNEAAGTEMQANQYVRSFRGTVSLHSNACTDDADCGGDVCCNGLCKTSCNTTCDSVADCGTTAPTCNASCRFIVPACQSNVCALIDSGPCTDCNWCGDGDDDDAGEECDDGCLSPGFPVGCDDNGNNNNDACTRGCAIAECGDGIINTVEEECDDGNLTNGDGCDSVCMTEILCGDPSFAIDVVFVVDMSSSMGQGQQLRQIQAALKKFVEYMDFARDRVSVVAYSNTATVLLSLIDGDTEAEAKVAIDALSPSGQRNLQQGIYEARQQLSGDIGDKQVMIVLSGNKPNRWDTDAKSCTHTSVASDECKANLEATGAKDTDGIHIFTVGLGVGTVAEELLQAIRTTPADTFSDYYFSAPLVRDLLDVYLEISDDICPCDNGVIDSDPPHNEQCDDSNDDNSDDCTNMCQFNICGDGALKVGFEQCDDGCISPGNPPGCDALPASSGDGCSSTCMIENVCGDGIVEGNELCDDGGTVSGDGCSGTEDADPAKHCQPEEYIPPFCHTDGELCFTDDDCGEPDPVTCAECVHGSCVAAIPSSGCSRIFWSYFDGVNHGIRSADLDGSNVANPINSGASDVFGIAIDSTNGKIYWTDSAGEIRRANEDGSSEEVIYSDLGKNFMDVALDVPAGKVYWTNDSDLEIWRADLNGSNPESLLMGIMQLRGIDLDTAANMMYYADCMDDMNCFIQEANTTGPLVMNTTYDLGMLQTEEIGNGLRFADIGGTKYLYMTLIGGYVARVQTNGSGYQKFTVDSAQTGGEYGIDVDVAGGKYHWAKEEAIREADTDGSNPQDSFTLPLNEDAFGVALSC